MTNERILQVLNSIRLTGATNMVDRLAVCKLAQCLGAYDVADWIEANRTLYATLIFTGKLPGDEDGEDGDSK